MALEVGSRLVHYQVPALIGEGGMGPVYQATDTKLNRQVQSELDALELDTGRISMDILSASSTSAI